MPLLEDSLTRILVIGLTRAHHLSQLQTLQLMDACIRRACTSPRSSTSSGGNGSVDNPLSVANGELVDAVLQLTLYRVWQINHLVSSYVVCQCISSICSCI
jgi:hypothetical protein